MKKNIIAVKVGYVTFGFTNQEAAMDLFRLLGQAVQLTDSTYSLPTEFNHYQLCLSEGETLPELKLYPEANVCGTHTVAELKQQVKDREDLEQQMKENTQVLLEAPAPDDGRPLGPYEDAPF